MSDTTRIFKMLALLLLISTAAVAEEPKSKWPIKFAVNVGGMAPTGSTGNTYDSSLLIGGGVALPIRRWVDLELVGLDFGFGTTDQTQVVRLAARV